MTQRGPVVRKEDRESTMGTRGFSRARQEFSVLAEGRHMFGRRPKSRAANWSREKKRVGHYKDLTETGNRARKVSGTPRVQRIINGPRLSNHRSDRNNVRKIYWPCLTNINFRSCFSYLDLVSKIYLLGPVVRRPISANFNQDFFFFC